jgi:hypothetical protein
MNVAALTFHRQLLRLSKGAVAAYERYLDEEESTLVVSSLKERKADISKKPPDKKIANGDEGGIG